MSEKTLTLRYVAHFSTISACLEEAYTTRAESVRQLIGELDRRYPGFAAALVDPASGRLRLNAAIYLNPPGQPPLSLLDLDRPLEDGAKLTFW